MATKLDKEFVKAIRKAHGDVEVGFETLVNEVNRLEALCEAYEKRLTQEQVNESSAEAAKNW